MVLVEHQAKSILAKAGFTVPASILINPGQEMLTELTSLRFPLVAKAQVPTGRRGKRGGIRLVHNQDELEAVLGKLRNMSLDGYVVRQVLLEEHIGEHQAFYLSLMLDRNQQRFMLLASPNGGVDIEEAAATVKQWPISYLLGIPAYVRRQVAAHLGLTGEAAQALKVLLDKLFDMTRQGGILFIEINPLGLSHNGQLIVLDAKITLDDKASVYAPEAVGTLGYMTPFQQTIVDLGIAGVEMPPGNIAVITSGAGVGMATVDCVDYLGGTVGAFIDLGGIGAREPDTTRKAIRLLQTHVKPDAYLFNFFFQLADSKILAEAIVDTFQSQTGQPVARFRGHNESEACALISTVSEYVTTDFFQACQWAVNISKGVSNGDPAQQ